MINQSIAQKIKANNYRLTQQRETVLEVMLNNQGRHLSAEQVLKAAKQKSPEIGIATVYRTLDKLADMEILHKNIFDDKFLYELTDDSRHQHHHIICLKCGEITEIEEDFLHNIELHVEKLGYVIVNHDLKIYAYCPTCK